MTAETLCRFAAMQQEEETAQPASSFLHGNARGQGKRPAKLRKLTHFIKRHPVFTGKTVVYAFQILQKKIYRIRK